MKIKYLKQYIVLYIDSLLITLLAAIYLFPLIFSKEFDIQFHFFPLALTGFVGLLTLKKHIHNVNIKNCTISAVIAGTLLILTLIFRN